MLRPDIAPDRLDDAAAWRDAAAGWRRAGAFADAAASLGLAAAAQPDGTQCLEVAALWHEAGRPAEALLWRQRAAALGAAVPVEDALRDSPPGMPAELVAALRRVPLLAAADWPALTVTPAAGKRNRLYRIDDPAAGASYMLRLPRRFPASPWWRYKREELHLRNAEALGLGPRLLHFDLADGLLLTGFVAGETLTRASFRDRAVLTRVAAAFDRLHHGPAVATPRDMFDGLDRREQRLRPEMGPPDLPRWRAAAADWLAVLRDNGVPPASCHNDPIPGNMIDSPDGLVLIDWEFAGFGDPDAELGFVLGNTRLTGAWERRWLTACHRRPDHPRALRICLYRAVLRYHWLLKALTARQDGAPPEAWRAMAERSLGFLRDTVPTPAFQDQVRLLRDYRWQP